MTRDYKSSPRSGGKRSGGGGSSGGGGVFKGILIGLFVGVTVAVGAALFLNRQNNPFTPAAKPAAGKAAELAKEQPKPKTEALTPGAGTKQPPAPAAERFDFYKILPGNEEPSTARPAKPAEPQAAKPAGDDKPGAYLQVGAFQNEADADNLKAKLALLGVEANIQTTNLPDKGVWHRVRIGPLKGGEEIDKTRQTLTQNGIQFNLVKQKDDVKPANNKPKTESPQ